MAFGVHTSILVMYVMNIIYPGLKCYGRQISVLSHENYYIYHYSGKRYLEFTSQLL